MRLFFKNHRDGNRKEKRVFIRRIPQRLLIWARRTPPTEYRVYTHVGLYRRLIRSASLIKIPRCVSASLSAGAERRVAAAVRAPMLARFSLRFHANRTWRYCALPIPIRKLPNAPPTDRVIFQFGMKPCSNLKYSSVAKLW